MNTIRHEAPPKPYCHIYGCNSEVYELELGLPTLFCDEHRAIAVAESNKIRKGDMYKKSNT